MPRPGWPPHCTGIVSPFTASTLTGLGLRGLAGEGLLEAVYRAAVFLDGELREWCRVEASPLAVKLARPGLEEWLAKLLEDRGHRLLYRAKVVRVEPRRGGVGVAVETGGGLARIVAERVLVATGGQAEPPEPIRRPRCWRLYGVEERLRLSARLRGLEEEFVTVHGSRFAPGFFAWLAPLEGGREAVVGVAAPQGQGLYTRLEAFRRMLGRRLGFSPSSVLGRRGGVILRGPPARRVVAGPGVALAGDLLCASKPYTGGGLYAAAVLSGPLGGWLSGQGGVEAVWRWLRRELLVQHVATRAAAAAPGLFLRLLSRVCRRAREGGCRVDYDRHSSIIRCLV
jgi:flavin-dependent dehydrogenase